MAGIEEIAEQPTTQQRTSENSYQMLMEGKAELFITPSDDEVNQCNFSKLLRDLYSKIYLLEGKVAKLSSPK
jgi:hypothetical protein